MQPASGHDIEVDDLCRTYLRDKIRRDAVRNVSFTVPHGCLFGILGPNGAGKTTIIKMLLTTLLPTSGSARILGYDVVRDVKQVRRRVGYVLGGEKGFYDRLTAAENMAYFADLYEVPRRRQRTRIPELLEMVGLADRGREKVETFSRGMRQRLHIARSLIHDPPVLILDEPSAGIDPVGARHLRELTASLTERGKTVLLTTHYMHEAEQLCEDLVILVRGQIVAAGAPGQVKATANLRRVATLEVMGADAAQIARLRAIAGVSNVHIETVGQRQLVRLQTSVDVDCIPDAIRLLGDVQILRVAATEPTLEDAYISLVAEGPDDRA